MIEYDVQYKEVLNRILKEGYDESDRTGVGVRKVFDVNINVDLSRDDGRFTLPALGLRKVFPRSAFYELLWMLRGSTNANELKAKNIHIWDGNTSRDYLDSIGLSHLREGHGGKIYGHFFRNFDGEDQLTNVVDSLKNNPNSRRHMISLWHPRDLKEGCLPPCHVLYNFVVTGDKLNLKFYQRSGDFILGCPMNALFSAFFLHMMSSLVGLNVGTLSHSIADCHIYHNHLDVARELTTRKPIDGDCSYAFDWEPTREDPTLDDYLNNLFSMDENWNEIKSTMEYPSHPAIPKELLIMAV